ncbi:MAG: MFS transporter [Nocardioidaceae bacterium]
MLSTYRRVLTLPGAWEFSASGLVARLPISMVSLGIVVLVSTRTGSYALAGGISAAYLVGNAGFAVLQGRLVDRRGQSRVLPWTILLFAVALVLMMTAVERGWPTPVPHLAAAVAGAALPQVGSCVRARWSRLVPDKRLLQTAFALEAVVDEVVFLVGPTTVTFLATVVHPLAGLGAAVLAGLAGTFALVAQRGTEPPAGRHQPAHGRGRLTWRVLGPLTACAFAMGMLFGGTEVATVAFSDELGAKPVSGALLAVWALGSLVSGVATGALHVGGHHGTRFRWGLLALALLMTPLPFVRGFWVLGAFMFLAGLAISPTLIASVAWIEETVPSTRITEGISIVTTGLAAGVAPGAAAVGLVVDRAGASASFWVPAAAGLVGAAIAFASAALPGGRPRATGGGGVTPTASSPSGSSA